MNVSESNLRLINWSIVVMFALGFWLSSSLLIDAVIIPGLMAAGMMLQSGFASAGFLIFGIFNRIELLCAALVLTGVLIFRRHHYFHAHQQNWSMLLAGILLAIALVYTYILTPQISSLGLNLDLFVPAIARSNGMAFLHEAYWGLEVVKFLVGATLLRWCYRNSCTA